MVTKNFQKRVDADLLDSVSGIYQSLGTSVGEAFVMFLKKSEEVKGLPFELRQTPTDKELEQQLTELLLKNSTPKAIDFNNPEDLAFFFDEESSEHEG
ncbi:type II toxin-antitoxin system RelB/DinJ family antitoxin [Streptococcus catagoni]|uniref:type II toxin-antitoxin system RelB/DinJ family antitoxin n=1 Tax=Streptococcus catagoni TaxID=2654874 RepID=UPI00140A422A|nr:type II toxin-antitoxin system RelB/DinJ family antitoxin [Streptococcus catagoni]